MRAGFLISEQVFSEEERCGEIDFSGEMWDNQRHLGDGRTSDEHIQCDSA